MNKKRRKPYEQGVCLQKVSVIMNPQKVGCIDCLHSFQEISCDWSSVVPLTNDYIKTLHPDPVSRTSSPFSPLQRT
jgi:hypothetical protein